MDLLKPVKKWLLSIALKKMVKRGVQLGLAYLASESVSKYGIDIKGNEQEVIGAVYIGLEGIRNYLKTSWPDKFGWL